MVEYWNNNIKGRLPFLNYSIMRVKQTNHYPKTIIPSFQYSIIPIVNEASRILVYNSLVNERI